MSTKIPCSKNVKEYCGVDFSQQTSPWMKWPNCCELVHLSQETQTTLSLKIENEQIDEYGAIECPIIAESDAEKVLTKSIWIADFRSVVSV